MHQQGAVKCAGNRPRGTAFRRFASVAQMDRAFGSDPEGRWFESSRAHQKKTAVFSRSGLFVWILVCTTLCHKPNHIQYDLAGLPLGRFSVPPNPPQIRCLGRVSLPWYVPRPYLIRRDTGRLPATRALLFSQSYRLAEFLPREAILKLSHIEMFSQLDFICFR